MEAVGRLVWLYYIAAIFTLILGVWLGHVITLAGLRFWMQEQWRKHNDPQE